MFTKYNINDLYLAYVLDIKPIDRNTSQYTSVGYLTILKKNSENYIDLQNKDRIVTTTRSENARSFVIYEIEPLSKHYTQDGRKIKNFTRKKAINASQKYGHVICDKITERTKAI